MTEPSETDDHVGEPLPVGANDPSIPQSPPPPPGLPSEPDEIDAELARLAQAMVERYDRLGGSREQVGKRVHPNDATVQDARALRILDVPVFTTRGALLLHIQSLAKREEDEISAWAQAVRIREESREGWGKFLTERTEAEQAVSRLGLDIPEDWPALAEEEPEPEPERIPDDKIL